MPKSISKFVNYVEAIAKTVSLNEVWKILGLTVAKKGKDNPNTVL